MVKLASVTFMRECWPWDWEIYLARFSCEVLIGGKKVIVFKTSVLEQNGLQGLQKWSVGFVFTFHQKNSWKTKRDDFSNILFLCNKEHLRAHEDGTRWSVRWPFLVRASEKKTGINFWEGLFGADQTKTKKFKPRKRGHGSFKWVQMRIYFVISYIITDSVWG